MYFGKANLAFLSRISHFLQNLAGSDSTNSKRVKKHPFLLTLCIREHSNMMSDSLGLGIATFVTLGIMGGGKKYV